MTPYFRLLNADMIHRFLLLDSKHAINNVVTVVVFGFTLNEICRDRMYLFVRLTDSRWEKQKHIKHMKPFSTFF